jgi:hypothetical protein
MAGNGYEKIIAIDLLLISFWDMWWVQRRLVVGLCNIMINYYENICSVINFIKSTSISFVGKMNAFSPI